MIEIGRDWPRTDVDDWVFPSNPHFQMRLADVHHNVFALQRPAYRNRHVHVLDRLRPSIRQQGLLRRFAFPG